MSRLRDMLIRHEGLRLTAYRCSAGKLTIGYGRNLEDVGISLEEADTLLDHDISKAIGDSASLPCFRDLDEVRKDVVLSMLFNLGLGGFLKFERLISFLESKEYDKAALEMLKSKWANQVGDRSVELSRMMRDGKYF